MSQPMAQDPFNLAFVQPPPNKVIVLAPVVDGEDADFVVVGKTRCMICECWCWLGSETYPIVSRGGASPICLPCACKIPELRESYPLRYVMDERKEQE
jgi:hypothetical protein